jgi:hypothetical protein
MRSASSNLAMPAAFKAGLGLMATAVLGGALYFFRHDSRAIIILLGGAIVVACVLVVYAIALQWTRRRKSAPLERAILRNTAALPQRVSEPARRAALDDLRKKFEAGVAKFKAAGKDLYSLPWYLIVGEPGSGKTEAIRRCNVGFPPGLQDCAQGAGGTINMNWWFTNHAVILDTAGRLVFDDVAAGKGGEWDEFLHLLSRARPSCPVNGLLLVLPADSLITDSADQIEPKAAHIAQQLDNIQRSLGVRFPVFVIVSKCDLINGFREFFDGLTDPQLQHQMLGWSNPEPLDEPFRPEHLDQHLLAVRGRLLRRRQSLLLDPVHTDDPAGGKRIEQVDALYTFPDAFLRLAPRLRRYLEMIFMPGEWSPRPLFLRGIYFTSSVRDGAALDAELAESLKVPLESIKADGRSWERERAYFLRDLFMNKVFREKGLVTRAANTLTLQRKRKMLIMGAGFASVVVLLLFTWTGAGRLNASVGQQTRYWLAVENNWKQHRDDLNLVQTSSPGTYRYNGGQELDIGGETKPNLAVFFADAAQRADHPIDVPWVFRAQQVVRGGDLNERRRAACRQMLESAVLVPVVEAARQQFRDRCVTVWDENTQQALGELLRLEVGAVKLGETTPIRLEPLLKVVLSKEDYTRYEGDHRPALREAIELAYAKSPGAWPPASLGGDSDNARAAIDNGIDALDHFLHSRSLGGGGGSGATSAVEAFQEAAKRFRDSEKDFLEAAPPSPAAVATMTVNDLDKWTDILRGTRPDVMRLKKVIEDMNVQGGADASAAPGSYKSQINREIAESAAIYKRLGEQIPAISSVTASAADASPALRHLFKVRQALETDLPERLQNDLRAAADARGDDLMLAEYRSKRRGLDGAPHDKYEVLASIYSGLVKQADFDPATQDPRTFDAQATDMLKQLGVIAKDDAPVDYHLRSVAKAASAYLEGTIRLRGGKRNVGGGGGGQ